MKIFKFLIPGLFIFMQVQGQSYTSYFTGNLRDTVCYPGGGICLMGGATENDEAMRWFLQRCDHGDVLVLRASGADGYNDYLFKELGEKVNSVESIVFNSKAASAEAYIQQKIEQAEGIWLAGGDQWNYVSYWRHTAIDSLINIAIKDRGVVIGGTSAGMAIQGGYYFSARKGTVSSEEALANPYDPAVTVDSAAFIRNELLQDVITDTHFNNPDRRGRHLAFLARILQDWQTEAKGIACNEYTAVCIDTNGLARAFGHASCKSCFVYFTQVNCELPIRTPETCSPGVPLEWNLGQAAISVCILEGKPDGSNTFQVRDWKPVAGGSWEHWYASAGIFSSSNATEPVCTGSILPSLDDESIRIFPNPAMHGSFSFNQIPEGLQRMSLLDVSGRIIMRIPVRKNRPDEIQCPDLSTGVYVLLVETNRGSTPYKLIIR